MIYDNVSIHDVNLYLQGHEEKPVCLPPGLHFFYLETIRYQRLQDSIRFYSDTRNVFSVMRK